MAAVLYIISQMCNIYYALKASNHSQSCRYTLMQLRQQESPRPVLYVKIFVVYRWHQMCASYIKMSCMLKPEALVYAISAYYNNMCKAQLLTK